MFHGVDPTGAHTLAQRVFQASAGLGDAADRLASLALSAEIHLKEGTVGRLDDSAHTLRATARAIETAAHDIGTFRVWVPSAWRPLAGLRARLGDHEYRRAEEDLYAQLVQAIAARETPAEAGLSEDHFPPGYLDWLVADRAVVAAAERLADYRSVAGSASELFDGATEYRLAQELHMLTEARAELPFQQAIDGLSGGEASVHVTEFAIAAALAGSFGSGAELLGRYLADGALEVDDAGFVDLLIRDTDAATVFFNHIGARSTVALSHRWADNGAGLDGPTETLDTLAQALAAVERRGDLAFTGSELVAAGVPLYQSPRPFPSAAPSFHIEQLLMRGDFTVDFVISAARGSFDHHGVGDYPGAVPGPLLVDRRITALAAVVKHDATTAFIDSLDDGELAAVLGLAPAPSSAWTGGPYGVEHPSLGTGDAAVSIFFGSIMVDAATTNRVIDALARPGAIVADTRVADGLGLAMAHVALDHHATDREAVFLNAYEQLVASGGGLPVALAGMGDMTTDFVRGELASGWLDRNGETAVAYGDFLGQIRAIYLDGAVARAEDLLAGDAETERLLATINGIGTALSAIGTVGGLAGGLTIGGIALGIATFGAISLVALGIGVVLLGLGLARRDVDDPRVLILSDAGVEYRIEDDVFQHAVLRALDEHPLQIDRRGELDDWSRLLADTISDGSDQYLISVLEQVEASVAGG